MRFGVPHVYMIFPVIFGYKSFLGYSSSTSSVVISTTA